MKIIIKQKAYTKLRYFVNLTDQEISGMGKSHIDENKDIIVDDFIIFYQTCTGATTEIDSKSIAKFLYDLQKNNQKTEDWNIWWHSHSTMDVFWSSKDDKTIEDHAGGQSYLISLVTNKANEYKARLDIFPKDVSPFNKLVYSTYELKVRIEKSKQVIKQEKKIKEEKEKLEIMKSSNNVAIKEQCQKEIDEKVQSLIPQNYMYQKSFFHSRNRKKWRFWKERDIEDIDEEYYKLIH